MGRGPISLERQKSQLRRLLSKQPPIEQYHRRAVTDEQIRKFIRSELKQERSRIAKLFVEETPEQRQSV